ncbi:MAG: rRNA adenine dimethyltransferase family protein [Bacteriovoracia bacterium]
MKTRQQVLGQNFLHHKPTIEKILSLTQEQVTKTNPKSIVEIGPGKLALTLKLNEIATKAQAALYLVERDKKLTAGLQEAKVLDKTTFLDAASDQFIEFLKSIPTPIYIVSNLPYSASSQIIAQICHARLILKASGIAGCTFMVQKELATRMASQNRGSFSLLVESVFSIKLAFDVSPGAFSPPPRVKSTVLTLQPKFDSIVKTTEELSEFEVFCKALFSKRRKMLRARFEDQGLFSKLGISGTERPEELDLSTVYALFCNRRSFVE